MRFITALLTLLLSALTVVSSVAQEVPLAYDVENTGADCPEPPLPTLSELPVIEALPNPFAWSGSGETISSRDEWRCRRAEIGEEIQHYELGDKPAPPPELEASLSGDTLLTVTVVEGGDTLTLTAPVSIPEGEGPFPAVIGVGFTPTGSIPSDIFTSRDVATIQYNFGELAPWGFDVARGAGGFYDLYPDSKVGFFAAWSWGVSRIIDGLEQIPELDIDLGRLAVTGCSFAGKIALFSGALDERIALTIPQESGGGGSAAWRVTETLEGSRETLSNAQGAPWYHQDLRQFNNAVEKLPFDHHELMGMVAPRALLVLGNPPWEWLAEESGYVASRAAEEVYEALGVSERFGYSFVAGENHCQLPEAHVPEVGAFVDRFLLGEDSVDTHIATSPYDTDLTRWIPWETPELVASTRPVKIDAESGELGEEWETVTDEETGTTYIAITTDYDETTGTGDYPGVGRTASYEVTFPGSGRYELYARIRVGSGTFDDDSFFAPDSFGVMEPAAADDWALVNGLASAGFAEPDDYVEGPGTAGSEAWKWVNLSEQGYQSAPTDTFVVEEGDLTQTFQIGARENGLAIDGFAFAPANFYYTVANLDDGEPGVTELPGDTIPEPTGPPLAAGLETWVGSVYSVPTQVEDYEHYWNHVALGNAGKWGVIEGTRDQMNWSDADAAYDFAQDRGVPLRWHILVWGNQQPTWMADLSEEEQREEIREWFEAVAERYPDIDQLEVVNEPLHDPPSCEDGGNQGANCPSSGDYAEALGGSGDTGWDWIITAFEMADEIFPDSARLFINDYGILSSTNAARDYVEIIELLQERDLIDGIGVQGHAFNTRPGAPMQSVLDILAETGLPIQVTEMDVDGNPNVVDITEEESDQNQLEDMQRIFPVLYEHEAVEGITFAGWRPGLWRQEQDAYLVRDDGEERPALVWLREYLESIRTSVEPTGEVPASFLLAGNYPNPFNPSTQIRYELAESVDVRLAVFDLLGREVATLVDARQVPGEYTVAFDARDVASGTYIYRLEAGSFVETKKMVLVK